MPLLKNVSTLYTCKPEGGQDEVHPIKNGCIAWEDGIITWVGAESNLPDKYHAETVVDVGGRMVIPGLVDCHTHLCFGGWREDEFEMRIQGRSYLEIAEAGGGILSTVKATRESTENELYEKASVLLDEMIKCGTTTVECKSGYGLSTESEVKQLRVYDRLKKNSSANIVSTFLGAHTFPPEFKNDREVYIELLINEMIPKVAEQGLADFCDIFVERSAFSIKEARVILEAGKKYGFKPKLHADQLTSGGGAELAADIGAISADHLEQISDQGIKKMAESGVVGVTLPIASLYTQQPYLNCRRLVDGGVNVAVATDFNPGSAPSFDLPLAMMLTCNHGRLTPAESLKGATFFGAKAIGMENQVGSLEVGKAADFLLVDSPDINHWLYHFKRTSPIRTFIAGKEIN